MDDSTAVFERERPRLVRIATRVLSDAAEAEDIVQQAWLRLARTSDADDIENLPGWLTTVTTRLCLDRLRSRTPVPSELDDQPASGSDPADEVALADTVGIALQMVLDRLTPSERVAFVLHDTFGIEFPTVAAILGNTPTASRKLASRARAKVAQPAVATPRADWQVVDAFLAAARAGEFERLLELLAPDVAVRADAAALALGTPERIDGREPVASFFNGAAKTAFPVFVGEHAALAWIDRGAARVVFDLEVSDGRIARITFRADADVLAQVVRRRDDAVLAVRSHSEPPDRHDQ